MKVQKWFIKIQNSPLEYVTYQLFRISFHIEFVGGGWVGGAAIHILNTKLIINSMGKVFVQYSSVLDGIWGQAKLFFLKCFNNCKDGNQDSIGRKDGTMHSIT